MSMRYAAIAIGLLNAACTAAPAPATPDASTPRADAGPRADGAAGGDSSPGRDGDVVPPPITIGWYGNPQGASSLANTNTALGGSGATGGTGYSNRIIFPFSGRLVGVRKYHIWTATPTGYHRGDGGTVEYRLTTDDGTPAHHPTTEVLARTGDIIGAPEHYAGPPGPIDNPYGDDDNFRRIDFIEPVDVVAGVVYHLTVWNTSDDPSARSVSMDDFVGGEGGRAAQLPTFTDGNWGVLYEQDGAWTERDTFWMIGDFYFADGSSWGNGYMEVSSTDREGRVYTIDGDLEVREVIHVSGGDRRVTELAVRALRVAGDAPIAIALRSGTDVVWSGELASAAYPSTGASDVALEQATFARVAIEPPVTLTDGMDYSVELATAAGTAYAIPGLRDGSADYGFSAASTFSDGHAELREGGGSWTGWTTWSSADTDVQDLELYFVVAR